MNAKIKLLAEQAKASVPAGLLVNEWIDEYNRIFAELIVRECIGIIDEAVEQREPASTYSTKLREYFGIDEVEKQINQRGSYYGHDV